jgi:hypothetical protein
VTARESERASERRHQQRALSIHASRNSYGSATLATENVAIYGNFIAVSADGTHKDLYRGKKLTVHFQLTCRSREEQCFLGFKSRSAMPPFIAWERYIIIAYHGVISRLQIDSVPSSLSRTLKGHFIFENLVDRSPVMSKINLVVPAESLMASRV